MICFDFETKANQRSREIELPKTKTNRKIKESERKLEEKKQILFENSTWKFVFSEAIPTQCVQRAGRKVLLRVCIFGDVNKKKYPKFLKELPKCLLIILNV